VKEPDRGVLGAWSRVRRFTLPGTCPARSQQFPVSLLGMKGEGGKGMVLSWW